MTVQIIEFHADEKRYVDALLKAQQRTQELEAELKKAGKASQDAAGAVGDAFKQTEQEQARVMNALRAQLRAIGPEGSAAAKAMSESMAKNGETSEVAVNELLEKIKLINPVAAEAARAGFQTAKDEMAEASRFGEGAFQKPLDKLRAMGPEGRKAAELLKSSLVDAGKISQRSMADVVAELRKIDPAAAEMAEKIQGELQDAADSGATIMDGFATSTLGKLTSVALGWASVSKVMEEYNNQLERKRQLTSETLKTQLSAAEVQSEAATNFAGFDAATRKKFLNETPQAIAKDLKFNDEMVVLRAMSNVAAAGVSSEDKLVDSVKAAVKLRRHKPDEIPQLAEAIADVTGKLPSFNAEQAGAFLITSSAQFRGASFKDLAEALPKVVGAVQANSKGLTPEELGKQAGALLSASTIGATDTVGKSATTYSIAFAGQLDSFFTDLERDKIEARTKVELIDRKIAKKKDTEKDRDDKRRALEYLAAAEGIVDPGNPIERSALIGGKEGLREAFLDKNSVEMAFRPVWKDMLTPGSVANKQIANSMDSISTNAEKFIETANEIAGATPQLRVATNKQHFGSIDNQEKLHDTSTALKGTADEEYVNYLAKSRSGLSDAFAGVSDSIRLKMRDSLLHGESGSEKLADFAGRLAIEDISDIRSAGGLFGRDESELKKRAERRRETQDAIASSVLRSAQDFSPQDAAKARGLVSSSLYEVERSASNSMIDNKMNAEMREAYERNTNMLMKLYDVLDRIAVNTDSEPVASTPQLSTTD